jgi:hypothetical protein
VLLDLNLVDILSVPLIVIAIDVPSHDCRKQEDANYQPSKHFNNKRMANKANLPVPYGKQDEEIWQDTATRAELAHAIINISK